jgi:hypothetical protein
MIDGSMPYRDFLAYTAPGFFWFMEPIVYFFQGFDVFIAGRIMMYLVFVGMAIVLTALFWEMRKSWIAVFIPLLLVFLPLPSDKFIEIRPDTLAMALFIFGLWIQMRYMNEKKNTIFVSGLLYGASLIVSQKMLFFVGLSVLGFIGWSRIQVLKRDVFSQHSLVAVGSFFAGGACIGLISFIWFLSLGNIPLIWYSLTTLPFEANKLGALFPVAADFFFFPNDVIYGTGGYNLGYWLNLVLWVFGILVAIFRFVTTIASQDSKTVWQEVIISANFLLSIFLFVYYMPMKHSQYLIPLAVFVVWYCADGLYLVWQENRQTIIRRAGVAIFFGALLCQLVLGYRLVNEPKLLWRHDQQVELETLFQTIPKTEYILDLECVSLYYPNPYYITCMPIGQLAPLMSMKLPTVRERLEATNTRYIYQGRWHRTQELVPDDQSYVAEHFTSIGDGKLLVRNDNVNSYNQR